MNLWDDFWQWADKSPLGATIVGGLIVVFVAFVFSLVVSRLRKVSWTDSVRHIARSTYWFFRAVLRVLREYRPTSNIRVINAQHETWRMQVSARANAIDARITAKSSLDEATRGNEDLASKYLDSNKARLEAENRVEHQTAERQRLRVELNEVRIAAIDSERRLGIAVEAIAEYEKERARLKSELATALSRTAPPQPPSHLPLPRPRWSVYFDESTEEYYVRNAVERSVANEVRLDLPFGNFDFHDGAHWETMSGSQTRVFRGTPTGDAPIYGVVFDVTWYDEHDEKDSTRVHLPPWEDVAEGRSMRV